jgi:1-deoxy-D-xylulose 5-phosphate reductoisomerase
MRIPIQYALSYPRRLPVGKDSHLDFASMGALEFGKPDLERFPCLAYAYEAGKIGGTMPAVMNAANEVAVVEFFLKGKAKFGDIPRAVRRTMDAARRGKLSVVKMPPHVTATNVAKLSLKPVKEPVFKKNPELEDILKADGWARDYARLLLNGSTGQKID